MRRDYDHDEADDYDDLSNDRRGELLPHRGPVILVLGILGFMLCFICGTIAYFMGRNDMALMKAGRMDDEGRGLTQAGMIVGLIATIINVVIISIYAVIVVVAVVVG